MTAQLEASVQAVQPLCHVLRANSVIYEMVFAPTALLVSIAHPLDQLAAHHVPKVMSVRQLEHPHRYHVMQAMWPHKAHRAVQYVLMVSIPFITTGPEHMVMCLNIRTSEIH